MPSADQCPRSGHPHEPHRVHLGPWGVLDCPGLTLLAAADLAEARTMRTAHAPDGGAHGPGGAAHSPRASDLRTAILHAVSPHVAGGGCGDGVCVLCRWAEERTDAVMAAVADHAAQTAATEAQTQAVMTVMGWADDRHDPGGGGVPPAACWTLAGDIARAVIAATAPPEEIQPCSGSDWCTCPRCRPDRQ